MDSRDSRYGISADITRVMIFRSRLIQEKSKIFFKKNAKTLFLNYFLSFCQKLDKFEFFKKNLASPGLVFRSQKITIHAYIRKKVISQFSKSSKPTEKAGFT